MGLTSPGDNTPFADLDALYLHILFSVDEPTLNKVLSILAFLFAMSQIDFWYFWNLPDVLIESKFRTLEFLEAFHGYEPGELRLILEDLHSIVDVPGNSANSSSEIRLFHASLSDFLQDKARSDFLFIDMGLRCARIARLCTGHLTPWLSSDGTCLSFISSNGRVIDSAHSISKI